MLDPRPTAPFLPLTITQETVEEVVRSLNVEATQAYKSNRDPP